MDGGLTWRLFCVIIIIITEMGHGWKFGGSNFGVEVDSFFRFGGNYVGLPSIGFCLPVTAWTLFIFCFDVLPMAYTWIYKKEEVYMGEAFLNLSSYTPI
jgi:hypothetical protein